MAPSPKNSIKYFQWGNDNTTKNTFKPRIITNIIYNIINQRGTFQNNTGTISSIIITSSTDNTTINNNVETSISFAGDVVVIDNNQGGSIGINNTTTSASISVANNIFSVGGGIQIQDNNAQIEIVENSLICGSINISNNTQPIAVARCIVKPTLVINAVGDQAFNLTDSNIYENFQGQYTFNIGDVADITYNIVRRNITYSESDFFAFLKTSTYISGNTLTLPLTDGLGILEFDDDASIDTIDYSGTGNDNFQQITLQPASGQTLTITPTAIGSISTNKIALEGSTPLVLTGRIGGASDFVILKRVYGANYWRQVGGSILT